MFEQPPEPSSVRGPSVRFSRDVTLTIVHASGGDHLLVEASWIRDGEQRNCSQACGDLQGQALAREWTDQLADGREPEPTAV
jgi:hypothetical protein